MAGETRTGVSLRPGIQLICEEVHLIARLGDLNAVNKRIEAPAAPPAAPVMAKAGPEPVAWAATATLPLPARLCPRL